MPLRSLNELDSATVVRVPLDIRGWEVRTSVDDEQVGKVHDVLVDDSGDARYLDVDLGIFRKHVLLPVGQAATDESNDVVWVHAMNSEDFKDIPEYEHGSRVEPAFERETTSAYDQRTRGRRYHRPEYGAMDIGS
jgi:hypothetical protein